MQTDEIILLVHTKFYHEKQGRLNYFCVSSDKEPIVVTSDFWTSYKSDHSPVKIELMPCLHVHLIRIECELNSLIAFKHSSFLNSN